MTSIQGNKEGEKMKKYLSIFKYSLKTNMIFLFDYLFSTVSFAIHMLVFNFLWDYILKDGSVYGYNKTELIWYIVAAEFITYGVTIFYKKISEMVKDGTIANMLIKPINLITYFLFEQSANVLKIFINFIAGIIIGTLMTIENGHIALEVSTISILFFIISSMFSFIIAAMIQVSLGFVSFFMEEVRSLWFIIQKAQLLLVFIPIEFYSGIIQKILLFLPTTYMIYAPARILVKFNFETSVMLIVSQIFMIFIMLLIAVILYKKGVKRINVNGG